ncbi:MAG: [protein-PII] uridylyltransferase [Sulfuricellaceae bacterium]
MNAFNLNAADFRVTLQAGRDELRRNYLENGNTAALLHGHSWLVDKLLVSIWRQLALPRSIALIAVGGYGRRQLFPYSDIDLLILLPENPDAAHCPSLEPLVGLLWDIGLEVGHSMRTLTQCLDEAKNITVQTNLLEARFLTGNRRLFHDLATAMRQNLNPREFFDAKLLEQRQRHARYFDIASNLEPNLKENPGGLRDLQNILWISSAMGLKGSWTQLAAESVITAQEARQIRRHERLLENLRIRLHYLARRREDRLLFDYQKPLAEQFGLSGEPKGNHKVQREAGEQLMQRYYRTAKAISLLNEILLRTLRTRIYPPTSRFSTPINANFQARNGLLEITDDDVFQRDPGAILESFLLLQQQPKLTGMSATTLRALWRAVPQIDGAFRREPRHRALFMEIMSQPRGITRELRGMNKLGILGRYIPAFGRIVGQMQHDLFHVYTVDEHILMVVRNLRRLTVPRYAHEFPLCSELMSVFEHPETLYLAGLFHDIAKGRGGDHSMLGAVEARHFCKLHKLTEKEHKLVVWLVENHLFMSATAQKQDISDPDVIEAFAARMRDQRHLDALYLFTVADIRGTSPTVWNAWKGKLLENLYLATHRHFAAQRDLTAQRHLAGVSANQETHLLTRQAEALSQLRLYDFDNDTIQAQWAQLEPAYFLRHDAQEIVWHSRNLYRRANTGKAVVKARLSHAGEGIEVMIYTPYRDDLFARICSFFERNDFNIVDAKIHTSRHGYALDTFVVLDEASRSAHYRELLYFINHELLQRLLGEAPLEPPLQGRLSRHLKHFPITPEISIKLDEKSAQYILSVTAGDRPGLLSRIAQTLLMHGIHLHTAKITTLGERAEDIFLITGDELENPKKTLKFEADLLQQLQT